MLSAFFFWNLFAGATSPEKIAKGGPARQFVLFDPPSKSWGLGCECNRLVD